jgi:hypothetical protein
LIDYALVAALIAALGFGIEWYQARQADKAADAYMARLAESARSKHPDQLPSIALQMEAIAAEEEALREIGSSPLRFERAGAIFLSSYIPTAETLPELCAQTGVELVAFKSAFESLHAEPLARARAFVTNSPLSESALRSKYEPKWKSNLKSTLESVAASKDSTVQAICKELEAEGSARAARQNLAGTLPVTYSVLYEPAPK